MRHLRSPNLQLPRLVRRAGAPKLVLNVLIAFGATILLTRLFLELTGYPRLGSDTLHIAHLLYGGIALAAASLLMLVFASPTAQTIGSLLTGIGLGLFFDEVGKFITANNDYFYKPAAPIIYLLSLGIAFLYYFLNRRVSRLTDGELVVAALEDAEQLFEGQQTQQQHHRIDTNLELIINTLQDPDHVKLALALRQFTASEAVRPEQSRWEMVLGKIEKWGLHNFLQHQRPITWVLMAVLILNSLASLVMFTTALALPVVAPALVHQIELLYATLGLRAFSPFRLSVDNIDLLLSIITAMLTLYGIILFVTRRREQGLFWMQLALILELCVVNVFTFYVEQFSAAAIALANLAILLYVRAYQHQLKQAAVLRKQIHAEDVAASSEIDPAAVTR